MPTLKSMNLSKKGVEQIFQQTMLIFKNVWNCALTDSPLTQYAFAYYFNQNTNLNKYQSNTQISKHI